MLCVAVEFLHGTMRACNMHDIAAAGAAAQEWPPSPARLYQAFVAADGSGARRRVTTDDGHLRWLTAPPLVRATDEVTVDVLPPRYAVIDANDGPGVQNYPARMAQATLPGARTVPRVARLAYVWPDADVPAREFGDLQRRAARIPYLGCADSPVRVRVLDHIPAWAQALPLWQPDTVGSQPMPVADDGFLDRLDAAYEAFCEGRPLRRAWIPTAVVRYRSPNDPPLGAVSPKTIWLRFDTSVAGRQVLAVAEGLRSAVLRGLEHGADSPYLHGHWSNGDLGYEHVRWLPLPHAGYAYADGRIRGACIWLPPDTPNAVVSAADTAARSVAVLVFGSGRRVGVRPFDGTRWPWSANPKRWVGPSRQWVSVTPVVAERYTRRAPTLAEIGRWCGYAGLPAPEAVAVSRVPLVDGALDLPPQATQRRSGDPVRPYFHLRLRFPHAIHGPVVVGRLRHFGLGLCAPEGET